MKNLKVLKTGIILSLVLLMASFTVAEKGKDKIQDATNVLKEFNKMKENIPHELIEKYQGIVIVPKMINAGLGIGGKRGKGIAMVKLANGQWSDPVFVTLTGGSVGFQAGVQSVDLILVFKNKGVLAKIKNGDFTIGGDVSAAAGPYGRSATANTDYKLEAEIYSYSRSRGLFGGISVNGTSLSIDKNINREFYGSNTTSKEIFDRSENNSQAVNTLKENLASL